MTRLEARAREYRYRNARLVFDLAALGALVVWQIRNRIRWRA